MLSSIKVVSIPDASYAEVSQKAPLRWSVLYAAENGEATGQHGWWKCKDFLNDSVVYLRTGKKFGIYGYQNELKINEGLSYVALKAVPEFFEQNLLLLNEWLYQRKMPPIHVVPHTGLKEVEKVVAIPSFYWQNTFLISAITSLIRSCVYVAAKTFEECVNQEPTLDGYFDKLSKAMVNENVEQMNKLMYKNYQYDASVLKDTPTHTIHNAGLQSWINSGVFNK